MGGKFLGWVRWVEMSYGHEPGGGNSVKKQIASRLVIIVGTWVSASLFCVAVGRAQTTMQRIAVLTPGGAFEPVFTGLREGLERLGFVQGKNLSISVEDAKGELSSLG